MDRDTFVSISLVVLGLAKSRLITPPFDQTRKSLKGDFVVFVVMLGIIENNDNENDNNYNNNEAVYSRTGTHNCD